MTYRLGMLEALIALLYHCNLLLEHVVCSNTVETCAPMFPLIFLNLFFMQHLTSTLLYFDHPLIL